MKWLLIGAVIVAAIALVMGVVALIGARLPRAHTASRRARLNAAPDAVWRLITDVDSYGEWRADVSRVERLSDAAGKVRWAEQGRNGRMTFAFERVEPPRLLVVRIDDPDLPFGGTWMYEIAPAPEGSSLTITEHGEVYNPIFRFMARFVFGHEATLARYVNSLEQALTRPARS